MSRLLASALLLAAVAVVASAFPASAQSTRTFVSSGGDNLNDCSLGSPCKTFVGAINKTPSGGEVTVLNVGDYGGIVTSKSITIDGAGIASVKWLTTQGGPGVDIATNNIVVTLRNLNIDGSPTSPTYGIRVTGSGVVLNVQNCTIRNFRTDGIFFNSSGGQLFVTDSIVQYNGSSSSGSGIRVVPFSVGATAVLTNVQMNSNTVGAYIGSLSGFVGVTIRNSTMAGGVQHGVITQTLGSGTSDTVITQSSMVNNAGDGLRADGAGARIFVNSSTITNNAIGIHPINSGQIISNGTSQNRGNYSQGAPTSITGQD